MCDRFSLCAKYHASLHAFTPRYSVHICNVFVCNLYSWCVRQEHVDGTYCIRVYTFRRMQNVWGGCKSDAVALSDATRGVSSSGNPDADSIRLCFGRVGGGNPALSFHGVRYLRTWAYVVCGRDKNTYVRAMFTKIVNS